MGKSSDLAVFFAAELDARLGLSTSKGADRDAPSRRSEVVEDVEFALSLWPAEFPEESEAKKDVHDRLRMRLPSTASNTRELQDLWRRVLDLLRPLTASRWRLVQAAIAAAIVLILLQVFQVPVWASLQRFVGYGYAPRAGFVPLEGTMVLPRPVVLDEEGGGVEIEQIVLTHSTFELWVVSDRELPPPGIASINLPDSEFPELVDAYRQEISRDQLQSYWRYRGEFVSAPWIELRLEGFQTRRIPLQRAVELLAPLRTFRVCDTRAGISICAVALTVDQDLTCSLIEINLQDAALVDGYPALVVDPVESGSAITMRSAVADGSARVQPGLVARALKVSGDQAVFLQQLCFQGRLTGDVLLEIPAVEVIVPVTTELRLPVLPAEEGWVEFSARVEWPVAEIAFQQGRTFPGEGGATVLRLLGNQDLQRSGAIITGFTPRVMGYGSIVQIGSSHDPAHGLHTLDIWFSGDRSYVMPGEILVEIRNPRLTFVGPYELAIAGEAK